MMIRILAVLAALGSAMTSSADAQGWPTRPVHIVVPYGPGSGADVLGRIIAPRMSELLGQPVVIENVAGAGGFTGSARVAKAAPDGYAAVIGTAATHAQIQYLSKTPPYLPADFEPVGLIADQPFVLITRKDLPPNDLQQFASHARANKSALRYGSPGSGSAGHLACALLNSELGIDAVHVPYRGAAQAMTDLFGGVIDYQCVVVAAVLPHLDGNAIKPIALLAPERSPFLPKLSSSAEQGLSKFDASTWNALFLPKNTPPEIVSKLNAASVGAMRTAAVHDRLRAIGAEPPVGERASPRHLAEMVTRDIKRWADPIRAANISLD